MEMEDILHLYDVSGEIEMSVETQLYDCNKMRKFAV